MPMPPFGADSYALELSGATVSLKRLPRQEAERLGGLFAAIEPWASYPYPASSLAAYFAKDEPGAPRFAVFSGSEIAGVAGLRLEWLRGPYLQFLGLLPPCQGRGLGSLVLQWLEGEARRGLARNLWVSASDFNAGALRFYDRHGFSRAAILDGLVMDGRAEVLLRKRL